MLLEISFLRRATTYPIVRYPLSIEIMSNLKLFFAFSHVQREMIPVENMSLTETNGREMVRCVLVGENFADSVSSSLNLLALGARCTYWKLSFQVAPDRSTYRKFQPPCTAGGKWTATGPMEKNQVREENRASLVEYGFPE